MSNHPCLFPPLSYFCILLASWETPGGSDNICVGCADGTVHLLDNDTLQELEHLELPDLDEDHDADKLIVAKGGVLWISVRECGRVTCSWLLVPGFGTENRADQKPPS